MKHQTLDFTGFDQGISSEVETSTRVVEMETDKDWLNTSEVEKIHDLFQ